MKQYARLRWMARPRSIIKCQGLEGVDFLLQPLTPETCESQGLANRLSSKNEPLCFITTIGKEENIVWKHVTCICRKIKESQCLLPRAGIVYVLRLECYHSRKEKELLFHFSTYRNLNLYSRQWVKRLSQEIFYHVQKCLVYISMPLWPNLRVQSGS